MMQRPSHLPRVWPWRYLALTYGWSWLFLISAVLTGLEADALLTTVLRVLAGVGPLVAALLLVYRTMGQDGRRDYWQRLIGFRRIAPRWYVVTLLVPPLLTALAALVDLGLGGTGLRLEAAEGILEQPLTFLPYALFILVFGPLPEEMGWRGYALDGLQARYSALVASLILGAVWALWHLPLFFIAGTFQADLGVGTTSFWLFMLSMLPQTLVMTWIYNHTRRSTLSAVLFHFMLNFTGELFELSGRADQVLFGLWVVLAVGLVLMAEPERTSRPASRRRRNCPR